jgi:outer membrane lipoprotein SlyB
MEMKKVMIAGLSALLLLGGCGTRQGAEYDARSYRQVKHYLVGTVVEERPVMISDNGTGLFIGALTGAVLGSLVGRGSGKTLATLGGGLAGAYVGSEAGKANAEELTVQLDNGEHIVVVAKGKSRFLPGDRIKIIKSGNTVERVERLPGYQ